MGDVPAQDADEDEYPDDYQRDGRNYPGHDLILEFLLYIHFCKELLST